MGRQDEIKAETLAESYAATKVDAINLTVREATLGRGSVAAVQRLSGGALTTLSLNPSETLEAKRQVESGPFLIGGADAGQTVLASKLGEQPSDNVAGVTELLTEAKSLGLAPVLLWSGDEPSARAIARKHPDLAAIVYTSDSVPQNRPNTEGSTWLLTPGSRGRALVSARWDGSKFTDYRALPLGPEFADDPDVSRAYARYLDRVASEGLLMNIPRTSATKFAGSEKCLKCHQKAAKIWKASDHVKAFATLEHEKHDMDPDCVGCHVVGLDSTSGFRSRTSTPSMTGVGCESCHGPAADHAMHPRKDRLQKTKEAACKKCHNPDHSPKFNFGAFWKRIRH
jgi:hypothetical protein